MSLNVNRSDDVIYVITNEDQVIYVTTIPNSAQQNIQFQNQGINLGIPGIVTTINFDGNVEAELSGSTLTVKSIGAMIIKGTYDASSNIFPSISGIKKGWWYKISVSGTLGGVDVSAGAKIMALVDNPSNSLSDWDITF